MVKIKNIIQKIPFFDTLIKWKNRIIFKGSKKYWKNRYNKKGNSGTGSYGKLAEFKAKVLNSFVKNNKINSVMEFGCGDSHQINLFNFPNYIGLDISETAIKTNMDFFKKDKTKSFFLYDSNCFSDNHSIFKTELTLSLDTIYHLVEKEIFENYMNHLFSTSNKFVIIYSSDINTTAENHIKYRKFAEWIKIKFPEWKLIKKIKNPYYKDRPDFFIYKKVK